MFLKTLRNTRSKIRDELIDKLKNEYSMSVSGVESMLSALNDIRDYVILLYDNDELMGVISYYMSKKKYIEIDHLGVIKQHCGYGTILIQEVFKIAKNTDRYPVTVITNGYSDIFYEKMGMERITQSLPAVYEMSKDKLDSLNFI